MAKDKDKEGEHGKESDKELTFDKLHAAHRQNLARKIVAGETGLSRELEHLQEMEKRQKAESADNQQSGICNQQSEEIGIPSRLHIPRHYTMTEAARKARSLGGKARAKKCPTPNWKHGKYARSSIAKMKPCKTNCEQYPCALIEENIVEPGETCLDMVSLVETYQAFYNAIKDGKYDDYQEIVALSIAQSQTVLNMLQEDIIRDGTMVKSEKFDSSGKVIGHEIKLHPSLLVLPKLIAELGMTPQENMITPRQIAKQGNEDDGAKTAADFMSTLGNIAEKIKQKTKEKPEKE